VAACIPSLTTSGWTSKFARPDMVDTPKLSMGDTYANVVRWCLERDEEHLEIDEIMKAVVERLEHLAVTV
jgi:hypothetical protein